MDTRPVRNQKMTVGKRKDLLLYCTVAISIFSQIITDNFFVRCGMYLCWLVLLARCLLLKRKNFWISKTTKVFCLNYVTLFFVLGFATILFGTNHASGNYLQLLRIPLLVSVIGNCIPYDKKLLTNLAKVYISCAVLFAIYVQIRYIPSYSGWITRQTYAFAQKNSAAQIWGSAILLSVLVAKRRGKAPRIVWLCFDVYLMVMICLCQCRTAILAMTVVAAFCFFRYAKNRAGWFILVGIGAFALLHSEGFVQFMGQALLITKYRGTNINTFSSGRIDSWLDALGAFMGHPVLGTGRYYVDCSYLSVLAETGIVGFCLIETIWLKRAGSNLRNKQELSEEETLLGTCGALLTVFYLIESLLEGYPPFGPGVSSFIFWLLSGIGDRLERVE